MVLLNHPRSVMPQASLVLMEQV